MSFVTIMVVAFVIGYALIAVESVTKINKAAIAILMCVVCWTLLAIGHSQIGLADYNLTHAIERNLGEAGTTLFFLMGAMTIVGSMNAGISGDNQMIYIKSVLDMISSAMLAASLGH